MQKRKATRHQIYAGQSLRDRAVHIAGFDWTPPSRVILRIGVSLPKTSDGLIPKGRANRIAIFFD